MTLPYELLAGGIALGSAYLYLRSPDWLLGPQGRILNTVRRLALPAVDKLAKEELAEKTGGNLDYAKYEIGQSGYVGRVDASVHSFESMIHRNGYTRMPLAALKTLPDGRVEVGSWAYRESLFAERQTHLIIFNSPPSEAGIDVYAHEEPNALNPATAWDHYKAKDYDAAAGVRTVDNLINESELTWK